MDGVEGLFLTDAYDFMDFNRRAKKRKLKEIMFGVNELSDVNPDESAMSDEHSQAEEPDGLQSCDEQPVAEESTQHDEPRYHLRIPVIRLSRCDQLAEMMRAKVADANKEVPLSTTCCAGVAHVAKTPGKSPTGKSPTGKSPRLRRRRVNAKSPEHLHKRLMLEPSAPAVCNCSELLRRLQTTITDPPTFHLSDMETSDHCATSTRLPRSSKRDSFFLVTSTASFDEAIVIDSDDSADENLQSEPQAERTRSSGGFEMPQSSCEYDDGESPKKPLDILAEPLNIAIKVSLPLPRKLPAPDCASQQQPQPQQPQQRNSSKKSHRTKQRVNSKRRKKDVDAMSADQEMSTGGNEVVQCSRVGNEVHDDLHMTVQSELQCPPGYREGDQETISTDGVVGDVDRHQQRSLHDVSEPDVDSFSRLSLDESDVFRENDQEETRQADVAVDAETPEMLTRNQVPEECVNSVPLTTAAPGDRAEEDAASHHPATPTENAAAVENEECSTSEKTLIETDTHAVDKDRVLETAGAEVEIFPYEHCSPPPVVTLPTPPTTSANVSQSEHVEVSSVLSASSNKPDSSGVHLEHSEVSHGPCSRLRLPVKDKSGTVSLHRASKAVRKKAANVRKSILKRQTVTTSTCKKFKKSATVRKRGRASRGDLQPQTENSGTSLSSLDDKTSTNTVSNEQNLTPAEANVSVQKCMEAEPIHVLPSDEQDTAAAAHPHHEQTPSSCPDVAGVTEICEPVDGSSVVGDQQANSQAVTGRNVQLPVSPARINDAELAELSVSSIEPISSPPGSDWLKATSSNHEPATYSDTALRNRLRGTSLAELFMNKSDRSLAVCMQLFSELQQCPDNQFRQRVMMLERLHSTWKYDQLVPMTRSSSEADSEDVAFAGDPSDRITERRPEQNGLQFSAEDLKRRRVKVNVIGRSPDSAYSTPVRENSADDKSAAGNSGSNVVVSTETTTTASSSAGVVKESSTAHVASGSTSDIEKLYPSMPEFLPGDCRHVSTHVSHAASSRPPSAKTSTARKSHQLSARCAWNSDAAAASTSTTFMSSKNQTNVEDAAAAAATVGSVDCKAALSSSESYHLSQSAVTKELNEENVFTAVEKDLQKSQGCSAFRTVKETCPVPTADAAEISLCHSMANHEEHGQRKCSAGSQPTDSLSASTSGVSRAGVDKQSSQLQDVEPDGNNNKRLTSVGRLLGDSHDVSTRLNCVASSSQAPATSDDASDVCQSKTNDHAFNGETAASSEQVCSTVSESETAVMDKDGSETATASEGETSLRTSMSGLDSFHQFLQLEQSQADQQVVFGEFQPQESAGEMELTAGEMEQLLTSFTANGISPDEQIIAAFDIDIPEVPLFQNYMTSDDCPSVEQQLAHAARVREISAEISDSSTGSPAAEIEESKGTVCDEIEAEPVSVTCSADESTYQAISAECPAKEQKNTNADGYEQTVAFRQTESLYAPLDLTCNRVHSTSNVQRPGDVLNTAVVVSQDAISSTYGHCAPTNMCSCQTSHPAYSEYCSRWSMVQVTNNYGVGWPPHPYPCCGHPGHYPGPPHSPMFPGLPCPCHGTQPVRARPRSRGGGTRTRRRPVQNSCSRVDGIRSTKVPANGDPSQMKDGVSCASNRPRSASATGIQSHDVCSSGGEVSTRPSSTSSVDTVINVPTSRWNECDLPAPQEVDILSAEHEVNNQPTECNLPAQQEVSKPPSAVVTSEANATAYQAVVTSEANAAPVASRGRGGRRRGGRAPRSSAANQPRPSVTEPDSGTQPVVRGRRRGRPRKHRDGPTTGDRTSQVQNSGVDPRTKQVQHPRKDSGGPSPAMPPVNDTATAPVRGSRRPRPRRIKLPAGDRSPVGSDQVAGSTYPPGPTDVERPKTCETLDFGTVATLTPPVVATGGTTSTPSQPGIHCVAHPAHAPTHCGNLMTASTTFGNCGGASTCPTAAEHHHHHHHHFPLMPPPSGSPADRMLCGPVATSGAIIRKPRSRKQGSRAQSNTTTPENTPGKDAPGGASPAVSGVSAAGESPVSWQPLVTESAISSLLDTLSVASSDHEGTEPSLTSCDIRLHSSPSIPFVVLERADLSRLLGGDGQKSPEDEDEDDADVDVCGLGAEEPNTQQIDDVLNVMESLQDDAQKTSSSKTTTTSELSVGATVDGQSAAVVCSTLNDSDVGKALDAALQNGIDGLLSTISDNQIACPSSTVIASSENCSAGCLLTTSVLPAVSTDTDQHYLLYSAHTEELIDTFLRSTHPVDNETEPPDTTAELTELQAVQLTAEDWPVDSFGDDVQMGGMLVEFDSSLLTIIELGNDQIPVESGACLTVTPGGGVDQVVNGETMAWNLFQGLEVSQFQVVGSEQATEAQMDSLPAPDDRVDDSPQNTPSGESADGTEESDASAHSTGPGSKVADDGGGPGDVPTAAVKTDVERARNSASTDGSDDDEYVLIVDCVDGSDPEVEYEVVDDSSKATGSAATGSAAAESSEVGTSDASVDVATNR